MPIAKNPDGSTITGPAYEYIVTSGNSFTLSYPAATLDKAKATLTHRVHLDDVPQIVPVANWNYNATGTAITLTGGFVANDIYEFSYTAKDPTIAGLGFAAGRLRRRSATTIKGSREREVHDKLKGRSDWFLLDLILRGHDVRNAVPSRIARSQILSCSSSRTEYIFFLRILVLQLASDNIKKECGLCGHSSTA